MRNDSERGEEGSGRRREGCEGESVERGMQVIIGRGYEKRQ